MENDFMPEDLDDSFIFDTALPLDQQVGAGAALSSTQFNIFDQEFEMVDNTLPPISDCMGSRSLPSHFSDPIDPLLQASPASLNALQGNFNTSPQNVPTRQRAAVQAAIQMISRDNRTRHNQAHLSETAIASPKQQRQLGQARSPSSLHQQHEAEIRYSTTATQTHRHIENPIPTAAPALSMAIPRATPIPLLPSEHPGYDRAIDRPMWGLSAEPEPTGASPDSHFAEMYQEVDEQEETHLALALSQNYQDTSKKLFGEKTAETPSLDNDAPNSFATSNSTFLEMCAQYGLTAVQATLSVVQKASLPAPEILPAVAQDQPASYDSSASTSFQAGKSSSTTIPQNFGLPAQDGQHESPAYWGSYNASGQDQDESAGYHQLSPQPISTASMQVPMAGVGGRGHFFLGFSNDERQTAPYGDLAPQYQMQSSQYQMPVSWHQMIAAQYRGRAPDYVDPPAQYPGQTRRYPETSGILTNPYVKASTSAPAVLSPPAAARGRGRPNNGGGGGREDERVFMDWPFVEIPRQRSIEEFQRNFTPAVAIRKLSAANLGHLEMVKNARSGNNALADYPQGSEPIPANTTLLEICHKYPNHIWGENERRFIFAKWSALQVYQAMPEDAQMGKEAKRPHCYIQQAYSRDRINERRELGLPPVIPKKRGRKDRNKDDADDADGTENVCNGDDDDDDNDDDEPSIPLPDRRRHSVTVPSTTQGMFRTRRGSIRLNSSRHLRDGLSLQQPRPFLQELITQLPEEPFLEDRRRTMNILTASPTVQTGPLPDLPIPIREEIGRQLMLMRDLGELEQPKFAVLHGHVQFRVVKKWWVDQYHGDYEPKLGRQNEIPVLPPAGHFNPLPFLSKLCYKVEKLRIPQSQEEVDWTDKAVRDWSFNFLLQNLKQQTLRLNQRLDAARVARDMLRGFP